MPMNRNVSTRVVSRLQADARPSKPGPFRLPVLILILVLLLIPPTSAQTTPPGGFANNVVSYNSGSGIPAGYTNASAALGEPSRITPGQFGGPVDPFSPPYLSEQLVSVGAGGHLTVQFDSQVLNNPANPFGIDFLIFGNAGFSITNGDFSGGGITDGSLFGANSGETRVSVSADGVTYYELTPSLAPVVDSPFPTDGSGNFHTAVNPALTRDSFNGKNLAQIRELYAGSGGGTPFDISWARDLQGQPAGLGAIQFVRVDVLSGVSEIDGMAMVVPEPATWALLGCGLLLLLRKRLWNRA
jgi:hypothetical protein